MELCSHTNLSSLNWVKSEFHVGLNYLNSLFFHQFETYSKFNITQLLFCLKETFSKLCCSSNNMSKNAIFTF